MSLVNRIGTDRWRFTAMYTVVSIVVPHASDGVDALIAGIVDDFAGIEAKLSVFRADSEISRWSRGELPDGDLSSDTRQVIAACDDLDERTGGLFSARHSDGYDTTGYIKGWALARAGQALDQAGVGSYCINAGGDIVARGLNQTGEPWRIGLAHPYRSGELATVVTTIPGDDRPMAVATSGTSERGQHIVQPSTGWRPVNSSVTVIGHDIALADAIATAALAAGEAGPSASAALIRRFGMEGFGFDEDRRPWWTDDLPSHALLPRL